MFRLLPILHLLAVGGLSVYFHAFETRSRYLCESFVGCTVIGEGRDDECRGSLRCCMGNATAAAVTEDRFRRPVLVAGICAGLFLTAYILAVILRHTSPDLPPESEHRSYRRKAISVGIFLTLAVVVLFATSLYTISEIIANWDGLTRCQLYLIQYLSWSFALVNQLLDLLIASFAEKCPGGGRLATVGQDLIQGLGVLWWLALGVYLEGAVRGRWTLL